MKEDSIKNGEAKKQALEVVLTPFYINKRDLDFEPVSDPRFNAYSFESKDLENRHFLCYSKLQDLVILELEESSQLLKDFRKQSSTDHKKEIFSEIIEEIKEQYSELLKKYSSELYKKDEFIQNKVLPALQNVLYDKNQTVINKNAENHMRRKDDAKFIKDNILIALEELPQIHRETFKTFLKSNGMKITEQKVPLDTYVQWRMSHEIVDRLKNDCPVGTKVRIIGPGTDPNLTKDKVVVFDESSKSDIVKNKSNEQLETYRLNSKGYDTSKMNCLMAVSMLMGVKPLTKSEYRDTQEKAVATFFDPKKEFGESSWRELSLVGFCGSEQGLLFGLGLPIGREPLHGGNISDSAKCQMVKYTRPDGTTSDPTATNCEHNYFIYCSEEKQNELKENLLKEKNGIYIASSAGDSTFKKKGKDIKVAIDYLQHNSGNRTNREIVNLTPDNMVHAAFLIHNSQLVSIVLQDHRDGVNVNTPDHQRDLFYIMEEFNESKEISLKDRISIAVKSLEKNSKRQNLHALQVPSNLDQKRFSKKRASRSSQVASTAKRKFTTHVMG